MDNVYENIDIPLGNSQFQIEHFITNELSPARAYRKIMLQIDSKLVALAEHEFRKKRRLCDLEEKQKKINNVRGVEINRIAIDIQEIKFYMQREEKLLQDCLIELNIYQNLLKKLPKFSREEFEFLEKDHWKKKFIHRAELETQLNGKPSIDTIEHLEKLGIQLTFTSDKKLRIEDTKPNAQITAPRRDI